MRSVLLSLLVIFVILMAVTIPIHADEALPLKFIIASPASVSIENNKSVVINISVIGLSAKDKAKVTLSVDHGGFGKDKVHTTDLELDYTNSCYIGYFPVIERFETPNKVNFSLVYKGNIVASAELEIHRLKTLRVLSYTSNISADGYQVGFVRAIALDQFDKPLSSVPCSLACQLPGQQPMTLPGQTDSQGYVLFRLPASKKFGNADVQLITNSVVSKHVNITYLDYQNLDRDNQFVATILSPVQVTVPFDRLIPITVYVSNMKSQTIPEKITLNSSSGVFLESTKNSVVIPLRDGCGTCQLYIGDFNGSEGPVTVEALVGNNNLSYRIGFTQFDVTRICSFQLTVKPNNHSEGNQDVGSLFINVLDKNSLPVVNVPVVLTNTVMNDKPKLTIAYSDADGTVKYIINKSKFKGICMYSVRAGGFPSNTALIEFDEKGRMSKWGYKLIQDKNGILTGVDPIESYSYRDGGVVTIDAH